MASILESAQTIGTNAAGNLGGSQLAGPTLSGSPLLSQASGAGALGQGFLQGLTNGLYGSAGAQSLGLNAGTLGNALGSRISGSPLSARPAATIPGGPTGAVSSASTPTQNTSGWGGLVGSVFNILQPNLPPNVASPQPGMRHPVDVSGLGALPGLHAGGLDPNILALISQRLGMGHF